MSEFEKIEELLPSGRLEVSRYIKDSVDDAMSFVEYIVYGCAILVILLTIVLPILSGVTGIDLFVWVQLVLDVDYYLYSTMGMFLTIGLSVLGACWGILIVGSAIMGASIRKTRVATKNLISVIFCEAIGIYGLIITIILSLKYRFLPSRDPYGEISDFMKYQMKGSGFVLFAAGICSGMANMFSAMCIGAIGASCAIADAHNPGLFVQIIVVEIFAEAIAVFAIFVGIIIQFSK